MTHENKILKNDKTNFRIAIIGLGYVGLPLAVEFGKHYKTVGFDLNKQRIIELNDGIDRTNEVEKKDILNSNNASFTSCSSDINDCNFYIVAVPTPLDKNNQPDFSYLEGACELIAECLKPNDTVIFESTVYPGATEEVCVPILERMSGLGYINEKNKDEISDGFFCGYSPERINPGDKERHLTSIQKVTSGSTKEIHILIEKLYKTIITAGTISASSIKIAEAAKVIENTQRDLNIALVNEFALIFAKLGIDTEEILEIASTKWNFVHHQPGLVGGHCIGVDPYYLAHKAIESGHYPHVILAGRETNNGMGSFISNNVIQLMTSNRIKLHKSRILILGFTFKEDCPDIRNTKVVDIKNGLESFGCSVDIYDPLASEEEVYQEYGFHLQSEIDEDTYDAIVLAVKHKEFSEMGIDSIRKFGKSNSIIFDVKYLFGKDDTDGRL